MNTERVIVSLSSIPPRFGELETTVQSLLSQTRRPDEIRLYIPKTFRRFGEYSLDALTLPDPIRVHVVDHDLGPATKVLPCIRDERENNPIIVYCDDDRYFAPTWLAQILAEMAARPDHAVTSSGADLVETYALDPASARRAPRAVLEKNKYDVAYIAGRLRQFGKMLLGRPSPKPQRYLYASSGYVDIAMGVGGVGLRPSFMPERAFDIPTVGWAVDDIWLSGCLAMNDIGIWAGAGIPFPRPARASSIEGLAEQEIDGLSRNENDLACIAYLQEQFGIWS